MNQQELILHRNKMASLLTQRSKPHRNMIIIRDGETWEHAQKKFEICFNLIKEGKEFYTEAEFSSVKNPSKSFLIADIFILDDNKIVEIQHSEKNNSIEKKRGFYEKELGLNFEVIIT